MATDKEGNDEADGRAVRGSLLHGVPAAEMEAVRRRMQVASWVQWMMVDIPVARENSRRHLGIRDEIRRQGGAIGGAIPWVDRAAAFATMLRRMQEIEKRRKVLLGTQSKYCYSMRPLGIGDGMAHAQTTGKPFSGVRGRRPVLLGGQRTETVLRAFAERRSAARPPTGAERGMTRNEAKGREQRYGHDLFPDYASVVRGGLPPDADEAPGQPSKNGWGGSAVVERRAAA
eukprot:gene8451-13118_t